MKRIFSILLAVFCFMNLFSAFAEPEWLFPECTDNSVFYLGVSEDGKNVLTCTRTSGGGLFGYTSAELRIVNPSTGEARTLIPRTDDETEANLSVNQYTRTSGGNNKQDLSEIEEFQKQQLEKHGYTSWMDAFLSEYDGGRALESNGNLALFQWCYCYPVVVNLETAEAMLLYGEVTLAQGGRILVSANDSERGAYFRLYEGFDRYTDIPLPETAYVRTSCLTPEGNIAFITNTWEKNDQNESGFRSCIHLITQSGAELKTIDLGFSRNGFDKLYADAHGTLIASNRGSAILTPGAWYSPDIPYLYTPMIRITEKGRGYACKTAIVHYEDALKAEKTMFSVPICVMDGNTMYALNENESTGDFDLITINTLDFSAEVVLDGMTYREMDMERRPDAYRDSLLTTILYPNGSFLGTHTNGPIRLEKKSIFEGLWGIFS